MLPCSHESDKKGYTFSTHTAFRPPIINAEMKRLILLLPEQHWGCF